MIAVLQRVLYSSVEIEGKIVSEIDKGLNILLGILKEDTKEDIDKLVKKIVNLRIFEDNNGKMNLSLLDTKREVLVVSQFTLAANVKKGRRPSFDNAMEPKKAKEFYQDFCKKLREFTEVKEGVFKATMKVTIVNDGPVTFVLNSKDLN